MTPAELLVESERLLMEASKQLGKHGNMHITPIQRDLITSLAMTGHGLAALALARMEAEPADDEVQVEPQHAFVRDGGAPWCGVRLSTGGQCAAVQTSPIHWPAAEVRTETAPYPYNVARTDGDVIEKCEHGMECLLHDGHWIHPSGMACPAPVMPRQHTQEWNATAPVPPIKEAP